MIIFVSVPVIIESGCAEEAVCVCVLGFKGIVEGVKLVTHPLGLDVFLICSDSVLFHHISVL